MSNTSELKQIAVTCAAAALVLGIIWSTTSSHLIAYTAAQPAGQGGTVTIKINSGDPPIADAGPDRVVRVGGSITLDGSQSFDPEEAALQYTWGVEDDDEDCAPGSLGDRTVSVVTFTAPAETPEGKESCSYLYELRVCDIDELCDSDYVLITVMRYPEPIADAGTNQEANVGNVVSLDGTKSIASDGTIDSFSWIQTGEGPSVTLSRADTESPTFEAPSVSADTVFTFELTVTDRPSTGDVEVEELTDTDTVNVLVVHTPSRPQDEIEEISTDVGGEKIPNQYLVLLKEDAVNTTQSLEITLQNLTSEVKIRGAELLYTYEQANPGFLIKAPNEQVLNQVLPILRADPRVAFTEQDQTIVPFDQTAPEGIQRVDAIREYTEEKGRRAISINTDIAIIDSGIDLDHPDLNIYHQWSPQIATTSTGPLIRQSVTSADDICGHGTHVAGIAAAKDNDLGILGVAPGARLWAIKVLDFDPTTGKCVGSISSLVAGIEYVTKNADQIDVVNLSVGCKCNSSSLDDAIRKAVTANVTFVVAAGNIHQDAASFTPANNSEVMTVSAIADRDGKCGGFSKVLTPLQMDGKRYNIGDDEFAIFSNYGDVIDIAAPGVKIYSTYKNNTYEYLGGTSQAAPHVAGAAALYKAIHPNASPAEITAELVNSGSVSTTQCDNRGHGYFRGDVDGKLEPLLYAKELVNINSSSSITKIGGGDSINNNVTIGASPRYANSIYGKISMSYDARWQKVEFAQGSQLGVDDGGLTKIVSFRMPSEGGTTTSLDLAVRDLSAPRNMSFEQYNKAQVDSISNIGGYIESTNSTTLGGNPAQKIVYTNSEGIKIMQIWTIKDDIAYHITYAAEKEKYFQYLAAILKAVDSLRIDTFDYG